MALSKQRASNRAMVAFMTWLTHNGYWLLEALPYTKVHPWVHAKGSWHNDTFRLHGKTWSKAVDVNWTDGGGKERQMLIRAIPVAQSMGLAVTYALNGTYGTAKNHQGHLHADPGSYSNLGQYYFTPAAGDLKVWDIQTAVHLTGKPQDNLYGPTTHEYMENLRSIASDGKHLRNVKMTQKVVGAKQDGAWGPASKSATVATVKKVQKVLGVRTDGDWGPTTDAAYVTFSRNYRRF